jgi:hypothetical protein
MNNNAKNTGFYSNGIYGIRATGGNNIVTGNLVRDISGYSEEGIAGNRVAVGGIVVNGNGTTHQTVTGNKVYNLTSLATLGTPYATGILLYGANGTNVADGNLVHSISVSSPYQAACIGMAMLSGAYRVSNNMIRLGLDSQGNSNDDAHNIYGMYEATIANNYYHNTVYVAGSGVAAGSAVSSCLMLDGNSGGDIRNNILMNSRSNAAGGGAGHSCLMSSNSLSSGTIDYNIYRHTGTDGASVKIGSNVYTTLTNWQAASVYDDNSLQTDPKLVAANGSGTTLDLHAALNTPAEGAGVNIAAVTTDYDGQLRSSMTPTDIGADAGDFSFRAWTGAVNDNWNTPGNWNPASIPVVIDSVAIPVVATYPVINTPSYCKSISIANTATVTLSADTLHVSEVLNNNGTISGTNGLLALDGSEAQHIRGTGAISNIMLNNTAGATIAADALMNLTGAYRPAAGVLTTNDKLTLKSTAGGTARIAENMGPNAPYISGNVTVERYIPGGRRAFRFFGHPFGTAMPLSQMMDDIDITGSGGAANGFVTTATNNPSAFSYNTIAGDASQSNDPGWQAFTSANTNIWGRAQGIRVLVRGVKDEGIWGGSYTPSAVTIDMAGQLCQNLVIVQLRKGANSDIISLAIHMPRQ